MSFGFGIGDFLALLELVNRVRKDFIGAPDAFKAISDDVRAFSIVLQDAEVNSSQLSDIQLQRLNSVFQGCKSLLEELDATLQRYSEISGTNKRDIAKRLWKRLKWEPDEIRDLRSRITAQVSVLNSFNHQATGNNITKLIRYQEDTKRTTILEWISPINYVAQYTDLLSRRQPGSRKWLFDSKEYSTWLSEKGQVLFCHGIPGTGKTFATAVVIESLHKEFGNHFGDTLTTFIYCTYRNQDQTVVKLLRGLLRTCLQLTSTIPDQVRDLYEQSLSSSGSLSQAQATQLLVVVFSCFRRVNVMVDGVDELSNNVRRPFIAEMLRLQRQEGFNLYVTSREIPEIQRPFDDHGALGLEIRASDEDVRKFLTDHLFLLPGFVLRSPELQEEVVTSITEASAGMFMLAELHLRSLTGKKSITAIRSALAKLTTGSVAYDTAYQTAMTRIQSQGSDSEELARQALLILTCARRPLLTADLAYALSLEPESESIDEDNVPDIEDIVAVCAGLVLIDEESNIVRLVHKSTQEYFERNKLQWFPDADVRMATLCVQYMKLAAGSKYYEEQSLPFLDYAKSNWKFHAGVAESPESAVEPATLSGPPPPYQHSAESNMQPPPGEVLVANIEAS